MDEVMGYQTDNEGPVEDQMICPNDGKILVQQPNDIMHCPMCPFNVPKNKKILDGMYAWVSVDREGREGFMAAQIGPTMMVLCHSELSKIMELRDLALNSVKGIPGYHARLLHFDRRTVIRD